MGMILIHSIATTTTKQDYLFEPLELDYASLFSYVLNANTRSILVKNDFASIIKIPWNTCLGHLQELGLEQGLMAFAFIAIQDKDMIALVERPPRRKQIG